MALTKVSYSMIAGAKANVLDFGAVGDGVANDTSAINDAIAKLGASGGTVYFPPGSYKFTSKITINTPVVFVGAGRSVAGSNGPYNTRLLKSGNIVGIEFAVGNAFGGMFDMVLDSEGGADASDGVYVTSGRVDIQRVGVWRQGRHGLNIKDANASSFIALELLSNDGDGLHVNADPVIPDANGMHFYGIDSRGNAGNGIYLNKCFSNTFHGLTIQGNTGYGIFCDDADRNIFIGVYSEGNVAKALNFGAAANYNEVFFVLADDWVVPSNPTKTNYYSFSGGDHTIPKLGVGIQEPQGILHTRDFGGSVQYLSRENVGSATALLGRIWGTDTTNALLAGIGMFYGSTNTSGEFQVFVKDTGGVVFRRLVITDSSSVEPGADATQRLGNSSARWSEVYAVAPAINTSDEREKQDVAEITDAERRVAVAIKGLMRSFRFKDAVAKKGDAARTHFGVMAQQVAQAFVAEGLDPHKYSMFCYDKWEELSEVKEEILDKDGKPTGEFVVTREHRPAGDRYGIRYDELFAFVIAAI